MNKVLLKGNVTKDVMVEQVGKTEKISKCRFTIAVDRQYTRGTDFIQIIAWSGLAESCGKTLRKGDTVEISGRIESRSWDDKNDPEKKRFAQDVIAEGVKKIARDKSAGQASAVVVSEEPSPVNTDDIGF